MSNIDARDPSSCRPPVRSMRPVYVDRLPPCNSACPAGENVQAWLAEAQAGRYREAWDIIVRDNPMPAFTGAFAITPAKTHAIARTSMTR